MTTIREVVMSGVSPVQGVYLSCDLSHDACDVT